MTTPTAGATIRRVAEPTVDIENPASLLQYLRDSRRIEAGQTPGIQILQGGVSNKTVWVEIGDGRAWVLKQSLAKLRVAVDWFSDPRRIEREALALKWLAKLAPPGTITPLIFEDAKENLLAMEAVPRPHENFKTALLAGRIEADWIEQFGRLLGVIHRESGRMEGKLKSIFEERSFFESLRVEPYYEYSAKQEPRAAEFLGRLIEATRGRRLAITHGDYSPKNVLIRDGRLILLDHEVIHWGDPGFDLGFSLTHLLSKGHHLARHRAAFAAAAKNYWLVYWQTLGEPSWAGDLEGLAVRHTLGCLLARVSGRSKLEYLSAQEQNHQREAVVELMRKPPEAVGQLVEEFLGRV